MLRSIFNLLNFFQWDIYYISIITCVQVVYTIMICLNTELWQCFFLVSGLNTVLIIVSVVLYKVFSPRISTKDILKPFIRGILWGIVELVLFTFFVGLATILVFVGILPIMQEKENLNFFQQWILPIISIIILVISIFSIDGLIRPLMEAYIVGWVKTNYLEEVYNIKNDNSSNLEIGEPSSNTLLNENESDKKYPNIKSVREYTNVKVKQKSFISLFIHIISTSIAVSYVWCLFFFSIIMISTSYPISAVAIIYAILQKFLFDSVVRTCYYILIFRSIVIRENNNTPNTSSNVIKTKFLKRFKFYWYFVLLFGLYLCVERWILIIDSTTSTQKHLLEALFYFISWSVCLFLIILLITHSI
eukprot:TRINITY_DN3394_c0_g1_i2.p1 TRINITY_DN3394_c0_g1~~TRINITY_DN3394_c0_g1_i2.p1  ORF type:complete len:361 (+),score=3.76 TRINITY_DN3394_c0_g1_i2:37-1119(+)